MYGLGATLSYESFVLGYVNKINPATGSAWRVEEVAAATGTPLETINAYITRAQQVNYQSVVGGGGVLTNEQIAAAGGPVMQPPAPPPSPSVIPQVTTAPLGPHGGAMIEGIEYFGPNGGAFKPGIDLTSYWTKDGRWYRGDNLGNVVEVTGIGGAVIASAPPGSQEAGFTLASIPWWIWLGGAALLLFSSRR